jgi:hypothetical protein
VIVKRLVFVFLLLATLFGLVSTAVAQSGPQQFVVVYVEFKPEDARAGGDGLQQLDALAEDSSGVVRFDVLQQIDRPNFFGWQQACDLGVRGDLGEWERLLGAQATAPRSA